MDIYNRKTGQVVMSEYSACQPFEERVNDLFKDMVAKGFAPSDATLYIAEAAFAARMEYVLSRSLVKAPCPHCQAAHHFSNATMGGCWNCGRNP
jgi:hypothetical protein